MLTNIPEINRIHESYEENIDSHLICFTKSLNTLSKTLNEFVLFVLSHRLIIQFNHSTTHLHPDFKSLKSYISCLQFKVCFVPDPGQIRSSLMLVLGPWWSLVSSAPPRCVGVRTWAPSRVTLGQTDQMANGGRGCLESFLSWARPSNDKLKSVHCAGQVSIVVRIRCMWVTKAFAPLLYQDLRLS